MDTSPIPGFITRKQAAKQCGRSERTLQRYWSRAIELQREEVLKHLRLRTEDDKTIDGTEVTLNLIDDLKKKGLNPTWYVHAEWAQETYGPRSRDDQPEEKPKETGDSEERKEPSAASAAPNDFIVTALRDQIAELQRDKDRLHQELTIKNEQIKEANARTRESNTLMQQLQNLLGDVQQRAWLTAPSQQGSAASNPSTFVRDADIVTDSDSQPRKSAAKPNTNARQGTSRSEHSGASAKDTSPKPQKKSAPQSAQPAAKRDKPKWYETPTLDRLASRLFR